ncbi:MAG TPA: ABC transporter substrate binding protein [Candidatus Paceibacterota bacterium]|nr:ABC transporter substrate binding protein [Candidatus Paceibacterota bacterium]
MKPSVTIGIVLAALATFALIAVIFQDRGNTRSAENTAPPVVIAKPYEGMRVAYIDSYHEGYPWSDGIANAIANGFSDTGVELRTFHLDAKHKSSIDEQVTSAAAIHTEIEAFHPDVLIVSDDSAFLFLVAEYERNTSLPVVFVGVNWDITQYGGPYTNTTGMIEVSQIERVIEHLATYAKGTRIGYLSANTWTDEKNLEWYTNTLRIQFDATELVNTMDEWEAAFKRLQSEADLLIIENSGGIAGWDDKRAEAFALAWTAIPVGTTNRFAMQESLLGIVKVPEEQGAWAANAARRILDGAKPQDIPITKNKQGVLLVNLSIAERIGALFPANILKSAEIVR